MSQSYSEHSPLTVYGGGIPEQVQQRIDGVMEIPDTYEGSGKDFLQGKTLPAHKIEYPSRLGGHAFILVAVKVGGTLVENYLREEVEGTFKPDEDLGNPPTAEG